MTRLRAQLFLQVGQKGLALNNNDGWEPLGTRRTKSHLILSTVPCFRYGCSHFTNMETKAQKDGWPRGTRMARELEEPEFVLLVPLGTLSLPL